MAHLRQPHRHFAGWANGMHGIWRRSILTLALCRVLDVIVECQKTALRNCQGRLRGFALDRVDVAAACALEKVGF